MEKPKEKINLAELLVSLLLLLIVAASTYFLIHKAWRNYREKESEGFNAARKEFESQLQPAFEAMRKDFFTSDRWDLEEDRLTLSSEGKKAKIVYRLIYYKPDAARLYRMIEGDKTGMEGESLADNLCAMETRVIDGRMEMGLVKSPDPFAQQDGIEITVSFSPSGKTRVFQGGKEVPIPKRTAPGMESGKAVYPGDIAPPGSSRRLIKI